MIFKSNKVIPEFTSRSQAFDYMFSHLVNKGKDLMDAASQANNFADLIAANKKLPDVPARPMTAIEQGVSFVKEIASIKKDNPEVWDLVTSVAGGLIGGITGAGVSNIEEPPVNNIDFDNLQ